MEQANQNNIQPDITPKEGTVVDISPVITTIQNFEESTVQSDPLIRPDIVGGTVNGTSSTKIVRLTTGLFGGDGTDGKLEITSGTTTIDLANAPVVVKNYSSIEISGTGKLAFSNPYEQGSIVILKSKGAVVLTSSTVPCIDMSSIGGAGGAGQSGVASPGAQAAGGKGYGGCAGSGGTGGGTSSGGGQSAGNKNAVGFVVTIFLLATPNYGSWNSIGSGIGASLPPLTYFTFPMPGGGGGGGLAGAGNTAGNGGRGGGGLYIECRETLDFTGTIWAKGETGGAGGGALPGPGGSGSGGSVKIVYSDLINNTGTINVDGGTGASVGQTLVAQYVS